MSTESRNSSKRVRTSARPRSMQMVVATMLAVGGSIANAQTVYNVAGIADFTGPYADVMKDVSGCRKVVFDWWNEEVGKAAGVTLRFKEYDGRYDVAQIASLWPGIKSELNPVAIAGTGGPDVAALGQRLATDKVPLVMPTAGYGFAWKPDGWAFNARPTYAHEVAAFYVWLKQQRGGSKPLKVAVISSEVSPAYVDIHKGTEKFAKDNPMVLEIVETVYTEAQPTDLTQQINRVLRKDAEVLQVLNNTASVVAVRRALQALGKTDIPILVSAHNNLVASGKAIGDLNQMEGSFEVYGLAVPSDDATPARAFYEKLRSTYKLQAGFTTPCVLGLAQALIIVRGFESAVKAKGSQGVTGADVRDALLTQKIPSESTFGVLPNMQFSTEAPFPIQGNSVNIATVEKGKYKIKQANVPVPTVAKW